ncbi:3-keto-5-aminohexanoate cleavage protein, partial [Rhizobium brockwellii]
LEIFNDQFRGGLSRAIAADGHRSLIYLGDQVRRHLGIGSMTGAAMPERPSVKGVGFVEFATDEEDEVELVALLRTL